MDWRCTPIGEKPTSSQHSFGLSLVDGILGAHTGLAPAHTFDKPIEQQDYQVTKIEVWKNIEQLMSRPANSRPM